MKEKIHLFSTRNNLPVVFIKTKEQQFGKAREEETSEGFFFWQRSCLRQPLASYHITIVSNTMASSFGFKKGFLKKKSSSSSSSSTTTTTNPPPSTFQTARPIPKENDDAATKVAAETSPSPPSSSSNPSQQLERENDAATNTTTEASLSPPLSTASGFRAPLPGRDECPICCHILPLGDEACVYNPCCGKLICNGCIVGRQRAQLESTGYIINGITPEEKQFRLIMKRWSNLCPFCRSKDAEDNKGYVERVLNRITIRNNEDYTLALMTLGSFYTEGGGGLPQSIQKAKELFQQAYDLDYPPAAFHLFNLYKRHHPDQKEKKMEYIRRGEALGDVKSIQELANHAVASKNYTEFTRLSMKAACLGNDTTRDNLMKLYKVSEAQLLSKDDLAITLRAHQAINGEMKTVQRGYGKRFQIFRERFSGMVST